MSELISIYQNTFLQAHLKAVKALAQAKAFKRACKMTIFKMIYIEPNLE